MSSTVKNFRLPAGFGDLERFSDWLVGSEWDRVQTRMNKNEMELSEIYHAVLPRLDDITACLGKFSLDELPVEELALFNLAKMMIETANIVERGRSTLGWRFEVARLVPLHEKRV